MDSTLSEMMIRQLLSSNDAGASYEQEKMLS